MFNIHEIITPPRALLKGNNREVRDKRYTLDFEATNIKLLSKVSSQNSSIMIWLPTNFVEPSNDQKLYATSTMLILCQNIRVFVFLERLVPLHHIRPKLFRPLDFPAKNKKHTCHMEMKGS